MSVTVIAFVLLAVTTILILAATMVFDLNLNRIKLAQTGDSSLSPRSVNWLAGIALIAALWICFA